MTDRGPTEGVTDRVRDVDVATLLGEKYDAFETVVSGEFTGPLAVVGSPFGGRETVIGAAAERLGATRFHLDPTDGPDALPELGDEPVVVDGCQHLYRRAIDGFEPLERFIRSLAGVDTPVVTGWNRYAWAYLAAVRGVDRAFPALVDVGPVATGDIAELLLDRYDGMPRFIPEESGTAGPVTVRRYDIGWRGRAVSVPVPVPNPGALGRLRGGADPDPADVVFERLAAVSNGNVGVATAIWESRRGDELRPADIVATGADLDIDRDEAFCLRIVLAKERVERAELVDIVGDDVDRILGRLVREGLVDTEGDVVRLEPSAVPSVEAATERRRIL